MSTNAYPEPILWRKSPLPHHATWWSSVRAEAAIEFGHFQVLFRPPRLLADGAPVEIGTRGFDLLLLLLEAHGALVTKRELLNRVWLSVVVSQENLKVHVSALRKILGRGVRPIRCAVGQRSLSSPLLAYMAAVIGLVAVGVVLDMFGGVRRPSGWTAALRRWLGVPV